MAVTKEASVSATPQFRDFTTLYKDSVPIPLPVNANDVRRYTDGANGIVNVIPSPVIKKDPETETAYVSLHEVISLYLPFGLPARFETDAEIYASCDKEEDSHPVNTYKHTKRAQDLLKASDENSAQINIDNINTPPCKNMFLCIWSDGCDPNARNKTNRGSMHITTVSILSDVHRNSEQNTFVVSIGREGGNHSEVRKLIYEELNTLGKMHYYFDGKKYIPLKIHLFCNLADRPERSESTGFGYHSGEITMRWGYVSPIPEDLPSCVHCFDRRASNQPRLKCNLCHDWDFSCIKIRVDKEYPKDVDEYNDGYISSHRFCYKNALESSKLCYLKLKNKLWTKLNAKSYLRHKGMNNKISDRIVAIATSGSDAKVEDVVPPLWLPEFKSTMKNQIPAFMHLCFLGVTQTLGVTIKEMLNAYGKYTKFREKEVLQPLRVFTLDWCRIWIYGSMKTPYGPWTAENYLAYSRIIKCVYSVIPSILCLRSDCPKLKRISTLVVQVTSAFNAMLARIMQPNCSSALIEDTERHIKLFLSIFTTWDDLVAAMGEKKRKRKINSTSNLTSLLNIPAFMREYGPPRLYWEGGYKGEGILRTVKPVVTQGTHMSWFATAALQRYYKEKSMELLLLAQNDESAVEETKIQQIYSYSDRKVYAYRQGVNQLQVEINSGNPISAAYCKTTDTTYCIVIEDKKRQMIAINFHDDSGSFLGHTYCTPISLNHSNILPVGPYDDFIAVMILPHHAGLSVSLPIFFCISELWTERTRLPCGIVHFALPKIDFITY